MTRTTTDDFLSAPPTTSCADAAEYWFDESPPRSTRSASCAGPSSDPTEHLPHARLCSRRCRGRLPGRRRRGSSDNTANLLAEILARGVSLQLKRGLAGNTSTANRRSPRGERLMSESLWKRRTKNQNQDSLCLVVTVWRQNTQI